MPRKAGISCDHEFDRRPARRRPARASLHDQLLDPAELVKYGDENALPYMPPSSFNDCQTTSPVSLVQLGQRRPPGRTRAHRRAAARKRSRRRAAAIFDFRRKSSFPDLLTGAGVQADQHIPHARHIQAIVAKAGVARIQLPCEAAKKGTCIEPSQRVSHSFCPSGPRTPGPLPISARPWPWWGGKRGGKREGRENGTGPIGRKTEGGKRDRSDIGKMGKTVAVPLLFGRGSSPLRLLGRPADR